MITRTYKIKLIDDGSSETEWVVDTWKTEPDERKFALMNEESISFQIFGAKVYSDLDRAIADAQIIRADWAGPEQHVRLVEITTHVSEACIPF